MKLTPKQRIWLREYLECWNQTEAARRAGYRCKHQNGFETIGKENYRKLQPVIEKWIDEYGLSDTRIKAKIADGMAAKETKFFAHQGKIVEQVDVEALGIQLKYTELAAKVKGLFAPTEIKIADIDKQIERLLGQLALMADSGEDPT